MPCTHHDSLDYSKANGAIELQPAHVAVGEKSTMHKCGITKALSAVHGTVNSKPVAVGRQPERFREIPYASGLTLSRRTSTRTRLRCLRQAGAVNGSATLLHCRMCTERYCVPCRLSVEYIPSRWLLLLPFVTASHPIPFLCETARALPTPGEGGTRRELGTPSSNSSRSRHFHMTL